MTKCTWKSFESYINCAFGYWKISFDNSNWKLATYTCPIYYKKYICKHIVEIAMMQKRHTNALTLRKTFHLKTFHLTLRKTKHSNYYQNRLVILIFDWIINKNFFYKH